MKTSHVIKCLELESPFKMTGTVGDMTRTQIGEVINHFFDTTMLGGHFETAMTGVVFIDVADMNMAEKIENLKYVKCKVNKEQRIFYFGLIEEGRMESTNQFNKADESTVFYRNLTAMMTKEKALEVSNPHHSL